MADAATVTITFEDADGQQTSRQYGANAVPNAAAVNALAGALQTLTQLKVVKAQLTQEITGYTPTAAETNSTVAGSASITTKKVDGRNHTFNVPPLKAAYRNGKNVNTTHADVLAFLDQFNDAAGDTTTATVFTISDGEKIDELAIEAGLVSGVINR